MQAASEEAASTRWESRGLGKDINPPTTSGDTAMKFVAISDRL